MSCGIYCIENLINNKKYIGQAENIEYRIKLNHRDSPAISNAIKYYGKENFNRYIIEYSTKNKLNLLERYYIIKLHSYVSDWGYNITWEGDSGMQGRAHTQESKNKIRLGHLGIKATDEARANMSLSKKGKSTTFGKKLSNSQSKYYGVRKSTVFKKWIYWMVRFTVNKEMIYVGNFKREIDAALAYDEFVKKNNLNRPLNFPDGVIV